MQIHLVDGTYELFRHHYGQLRFRARTAPNRDGHGLGGVRGVLASLLGMLEGGATHLAVATDHVIESFRNDRWPGYKSGAGVPAELLSQFHPLEDALRKMGVPVWPMVEFEADDALASGAARAAGDSRIERVHICTPDKDLAQCVVGGRVVLFDRRNERVIGEEGVWAKFGVAPASIPDFLALVGDAADGYPGLPGWGAVSAGRVLARYGHLEAIPECADVWDVAVRGAPRLARTLFENRADAFLFRELATLRRDLNLFGGVDELRWRGPRAGFREMAARLGDPGLWERARILGIVS